MQNRLNEPYSFCDEFLLAAPRFLTVFAAKYKYLSELLRHTIQYFLDTSLISDYNAISTKSDFITYPYCIFFIIIYINERKYRLMTIRLAPKQNEFNLLTKAISEFYHDLCVKIGISDSVLDVYYSISALGDGCCQKDICSYAFTSKQTVHSAIHKLEKEGFIYLKPGKGREMHIFLTPKGERFVEEKIAPVIAMENTVCSQMAPEEIDTLLHLTQKYLDCLRLQSEKRGLEQ